MGVDPLMGPALPFLTKLGEQVLASPNWSVALNHLFEALGAKAGGHLETLAVKDVVNARREAAPYSRLDVALLERLRGAADALPGQTDPVKPGVRLAGIIDSMRENL